LSELGAAAEPNLSVSAVGQVFEQPIHPERDLVAVIVNRCFLPARRAGNPCLASAAGNFSQAAAEYASEPQLFAIFLFFQHRIQKLIRDIFPRTAKDFAILRN